MRKLIDLLNNRWVIGVIGLLALSALIFFGADYIKFGSDNSTLSITARLLLIAVIITIWVIYSLVRWGLEQRQNNQMVQELNVEENGSAIDPDHERSAEEIKLLGERFKDALNVLKKSKFNSNTGSKNLYQLPWYMIIGPPGAGKTTALVNSGLKFPLEDSHGSGALGGVGGTRNCDWWFTNDAVLIDTAGRYTTQDSHRIVDNSAWAGFLKLLKKYRPRRPLNGVVIAISLQELMVQTSDQRQHHAKTIRNRVDELREQLGISFPVYLMFTKSDLVAGFNEFFNNLSQAEREQVWGMTFPIESDNQSDIGEHFQREYQLLIKRLNDRLIWRVDNERNIDAKALIQSFPNRMDALAVNLREFVAATFAPNKYSDSPMLRGIYFSSATQEGTPIDRMMASVSANFGLPRSVAAPQAGAGKSFFLNRLINDVIFTESELVGTNRTFESLLRWGRRTAFVALALASVAIIAAWSGTIAHNREAVAEVTFAADQFEEASGKIRPGGQNILPTLNVLNPLRKASGVYDKGLQPWFTGLGLYDDRVNKAAKALYQRNLHSYFLPAFRSSLERDIATLTSEDLELPSTLGTYIMLSDPKHQNNTVIIAWAEKHWQKRLIGKARERQQLLGHLQATLAQPLPASEPNPSVMKTARQQLSRIPLSQRLYKKLQLEHNRPVDLYEPIGGDSELIFGLNPDSPAFTMSELYTKAGFNEVDYSSNSNLIDKLEQDRWIFGNSEDTVFGVAERKELSQQIERAYLTDYSRNWERFLEALNIAPFGNLSSAVNVLEQLSDPSYSPLLATLEMVTENTQLRPPLVMSASESKSVSGLVPDNLQPTVVDKKFRELHRLTTSQKDRPAPVQKVLNAIADLKEFMSEMSSSDNSGEAAFNVAKNRFSSSAVNNPIQVIRKLAGRSSAPMKQWLQQIADHSWTVVLSTASRHVSNEWNQQVYSKYADLLVNRYPFDRNSDRETSLVDFNSFIGPKGIEITFFKTYLQPFIDTRKWKSKSIDGNTLSISNKAMEQFRLARTLRKALYSGSDEQMVFKFKMLPKKLDAGIKRFTLEIANSRLSYSHGPQISKDVTWTSGQDDRVRLLFEDLNGDNHRQEYSGDWAWMRLLDASNLEKGANSRQYLATFSVGSRKSEYQLTTKSSANPFNTSLLRGYKCPSRL